MIFCIWIFCVLGCDIALAGSGYITSSDTKYIWREKNSIPMIALW